MLAVREKSHERESAQSGENHQQVSTNRKYRTILTAHQRRACCQNIGEKCFARLRLAQRDESLGRAMFDESELSRSRHVRSWRSLLMHCEIARRTSEPPFVEHETYPDDASHLCSHSDELFEFLTRPTSDQNHLTKQTSDGSLGCMGRKLFN